MNFRFTIIGVTETRICDRKCSFNFIPELYQDTVLNQSRHLYVPVVLACSLIKIVNAACLNESPILAIKPFGLNFICLTIRNLYVVLLIGNTITLMSFWNTCQIFLNANAVKTKIFISWETST